MKPNLKTILASLLSLTLLSAGLVYFIDDSQRLGPVIMFFAAIKFSFVAFFFMDLRKAHGFWQGFVLFFAGLMVLLSLLV